MRRIALLLALIVGSGCRSIPTVAATAPALNATELETMLRSGQYAELDHYLLLRQQDYDRGVITEEDLRNAYRAFYSTDPQNAPQYDAWIRTFPKSYPAHLAKGIYCKRVGADKRGGTYLDRTTPGQLRDMQNWLSTAKRELDESITLEARPMLSYVQEIDVAGMLGDPNHGQRYLYRALELDPALFIARARYMYNLQTRWGGSLAQMQAFFDDFKAQLSKEHRVALESVLAEEQGWVYLHEDRDPVAAQKAYQRASQLNPDLCLSCFKKELADLLMDQHKYADALIVMTDILHKDPNIAGVLFNRGLANMRLANAQDAIADWQKAADLGQAEAMNELGKSYMLGVSGVLDKNPEIGIGWFRKSAAQGNAAAIQNLAIATSKPSMN